MGTQPGVRLEPALAVFLDEVSAETLRIAAAFVSRDGVERVTAAVEDGRVVRVRLLAGLDDAVTDPAALELALSEGWEVRVTERPGRLFFHPKLYWAEHADGTGSLYVGSGNLTRGGLSANTEMGLVVQYEDAPPSDLSHTWERWWGDGHPMTAGLLAQYQENYDLRRAQQDSNEAAPRLGIAPLQAVGGGRTFLIRGNLLGGSRSSLQTNEPVGKFFGLHDGGAHQRISVTFEDTTKDVDVTLNHEGQTLQINFGRAGLHHELGGVLTREDLLVLREIGQHRYTASVVPVDSAEGDELLRQAGCESADRFVAGVVSD